MSFLLLYLCRSEWDLSGRSEVHPTRVKFSNEIFRTQMPIISLIPMPWFLINIILGWQSYWLCYLRTHSNLGKSQKLHKNNKTKLQNWCSFYDFVGTFCLTVFKCNQRKFQMENLDEVSLNETEIQDPETLIMSNEAAETLAEFCSNDSGEFSPSQANYERFRTITAILSHETRLHVNVKENHRQDSFLKPKNILQPSNKDTDAISSSKIVLIFFFIKFWFIRIMLKITMYSILGLLLVFAFRNTNFVYTKSVSYYTTYENNFFIYIFIYSYNFKPIWKKFLEILDRRWDHCDELCMVDILIFSVFF